MARRLAPEVNAGSMADIAFLLLIFFLVSTTIETDYGISRKLPPPENQEDKTFIKEKNLFQIEINQANRLFVEKKPIDLKELRAAAIAFLDNGGGDKEDSCSYCRGLKEATSSDNPTKAVISLINSRETSYATYVAVQNELVAAYTELRNREAIRLYNVSFIQMKEYVKDVNYSGDKLLLREQIHKILSMYPDQLSEAALNEEQSLNI
ncbi:biopolymer transporter ExbD [Aquimarina addita]|uniref:Biopolymer transporter ExbD n=1 Tax=Aquimarina addita TaxID=870485 RepID=A0ABP6ULD1_9FLAO